MLELQIYNHLCTETKFEKFEENIRIIPMFMFLRHNEDILYNISTYRSSNGYIHDSKYKYQ